MKCTKNITPALWSEVETYLFIDLKLSENKGNKQSIRSRFFILAKNFQDKPLTRENFNTFIYDMKNQGYKESYINGFIKLAKHIDKLYGLNEITDYTYFKEKRQHLVDIFTPEEIKRIADLKVRYQRLRKDRNARYRCAYYLLGTTGMRIGELLNLKWEDYFGDYCILRETKNGDERVVPIPDFVVQIINNLPRTNERVFGTLDDSAINQDLKVRCKKLNINKQRLTVHVFRHSFITTMLKQNQASVIQIARIVGHKKIESTNLYSHMLIEDLRMCQSNHPLVRNEETLKEVADRLYKIAAGLIDNNRFVIKTRGTSKDFSLTLCSKKE